MGLFKTIIGGIGSLFGAGSAYKGQKSANKTNLQLAEQSRQHDINMWNMQNEYNTPAMQMQRLKEAGLNPNLIYDEGSGKTGNAGAIPGDTPATVQNNLAHMASMSLTPLISQYQDWQVKKAQIDNLQAQRQEVQERTEGHRLTNLLSNLTMPYQTKLLESGLSYQAAQTKNLKSQTELSNLERKYNMSSFSTRLGLLAEQYQQAIQNRKIQRSQHEFEREMHKLNKDLIRGKTSSVHLGNMHQMLTNQLFQDTYEHQKEMPSYQLDALRQQNRKMRMDIRLKEHAPLSDQYPAWMRPLYHGTISLGKLLGIDTEFTDY